MFDSKGLIDKNRKDLTEEKIYFISDKKAKDLKDGMKGADVFIGLSKGNIVKPDMLMGMNKNPIVFALANPTPEISYPEATSARHDVIMATGRSDYPNQVNNVLGFPFIFRGALDVRAKRINEAMKMAAVYAIAGLAKEPVPESVNLAYGSKHLTFGPGYIIPKPIDPRLITTVPPAVAKAALDSGVARRNIQDWDAYRQELIKRLGLDNDLLKGLTSKAKENPKRVVFAEADHYKILKAAEQVKDEGIARPILLGDKIRIDKMIAEYNLNLDDVPIIDPRSEEENDRREQFGEIFWEKRKRKGHTLFESRKIMRERNYFGGMMIETNDADAMISGITRKYADPIRAALETIGTRPGVNRVCGMYILLTRQGPFFLADTTMNVDPTAEDLAEITALTANCVKQFNIVPRIALLSYSNFGSVKGDIPQKIAKAISMLHEQYPGMIVDGDIQANFALNNELLKEQFPFSELVNKSVNTLIFPNLVSGNIAYKMMQELADVEAIGPILLGMKKPAHILQLGCSVREIVNMVTIAVVDAQSRTK